MAAVVTYPIAVKRARKLVQKLVERTKERADEKQFTEALIQRSLVAGLHKIAELGFPEVWHSEVLFAITQDFEGFRGCAHKDIAWLLPH